MDDKEKMMLIAQLMRSQMGSGGPGLGPGNSPDGAPGGELMDVGMMALQAKIDEEARERLAKMMGGM